MSETVGADTAKDLPAAWRAAVALCPHCAAQGCELCRGTGDLMGAVLADAYERGRDAGIHHMREVYKVVVFAGRSASQSAPPADLKRKVGL